MDERDDWDRHWSDYDITARYNPAQAFRRELVVHWLRNRSPAINGHLLDIGSGQGDLVASLTRIFPSAAIAGVEMSATGIALSRAKAPQAHFFRRDLLLTPDPGDALLGWAALAVCSEVLEHVDEHNQFLINAAHYLAPGALLFITVPGGPISAFDRHIGHRRHFTHASLERLIRDAGLISEKVRGVGFPFFNFYRMAVILRGNGLIKDVSNENDHRLSWPARMAMDAFALVLKRRLNSTSLGWQMTAQVRKPH
jgi:trans-aconitate methyltransferase